MEAQPFPLTMIDVIDMLISGREKLAKELVTELQQFNENLERRQEK